MGAFRIFEIIKFVKKHETVSITRDRIRGIILIEMSPKTENTMDNPARKQSPYNTTLYMVKEFKRLSRYLSITIIIHVM